MLAPSIEQIQHRPPLLEYFNTSFIQNYSQRYQALEHDAESFIQEASIY